MPAPWINDVAKSIPYDNSDSELIAEDVKEAIDELKDEIDALSIPSFVIFSNDTQVGFIFTESGGLVFREGECECP